MLLNVSALGLSPQFADLIREGYSQDSFNGNEGEWTKDSQIEARNGYFWRLDHLCVPLRMAFELYNISPAGHT
jgi:hypothetical protein